MSDQLFNDVEANARLAEHMDEVIAALKEVSADLYFILERKHGAEYAGNYPSLKKAQAVVLNATTKRR